MPIMNQAPYGQKKTGPSRSGKGEPDPEIGLFVEGISISGIGITPQKQATGDPSAINQPPRKAQPITKTTGAGTQDDPAVVWTADVTRLQQDDPTELADIESICRDEARRLGFRCVVIRSRIHYEMVRHDANGTRTISTIRRDGSRKPEVDPSDAHVTVYLGTSFTHCQISGHIFVVQRNGQWVKMDDPGTQRNLSQLRKLKRPVAAEYWLVSNCSQKVPADHPSRFKPKPACTVVQGLKPAAAPPPIVGGWSSTLFKK